MYIFFWLNQPIIQSYLGFLNIAKAIPTKNMRQNVSLYRELIPGISFFHLNANKINV